jgi:hypothetical protein
MNRPDNETLKLPTIHAVRMEPYFAQIASGWKAIDANLTEIVSAASIVLAYTLK